MALTILTRKDRFRFGHRYQFLASGFLMLLVLLLVGPCILACTCTPEASAPACQLISHSAVVFLGESLELVPDPNGQGKVYRFRVERTYKGLDPATPEVLVNPDNFTSCGTEYPTGKTYLIFARVLSQTPLMLLAGGCSGSRRADLHKADVDFLEHYAGSTTETKIYGKVLQWVTRIGRPKEDESAPLEGATVVLENSNDRFTAVSLPDGSFQFSGIPAGNYQLSATLNLYTPDPPAYRVSVEQGGCKEVFIQLKARSGIEGTLFMPDGKPAAKMRVELLRKHESGKWYSTYKMWTGTDAQGIFCFEDIESGDYLLGYEIWRDSPPGYRPYPTLYFPGVASRSKAKIISLAPQQTLKGLKLTLAPPHTERKITIRVVGADGKPPGENLLQIFNGNELVKNLEGRQHGGVFLFTGYQEREYEFTARYWIDNLGGFSPVFNKRLAKSDPVKLTPGKDNVEIKLVLQHELYSKDDR